LRVQDDLAEFTRGAVPAAGAGDVLRLPPHQRRREFCEIILHAQGSLAARQADYKDK